MGIKKQSISVILDVLLPFIFLTLIYICSHLLFFLASKQSASFNSHFRTSILWFYFLIFTLPVVDQSHLQIIKWNKNNYLLFTPNVFSTVDPIREINREGEGHARKKTGAFLCVQIIIKLYKMKFIVPKPKLKLFTRNISVLFLNPLLFGVTFILTLQI